MKWMLFGAVLTLAACSGEPAENPTANGPAEAEPAAPANLSAAAQEPSPAAPAAVVDESDGETSDEVGNRKADAASAPPPEVSNSPYRPVPAPAAPRPQRETEDPHAGHDMDNMTHDPQH